MFAALILGIGAAFLYFSRVNRRMIEYVANLTINQDARQAAWLLDGRPLPGTVRPGLIGSVTTTRDRLPAVGLAIQSMLLQTVRPERIELWLSDELSSDDMPESLRRLERYGLRINFVPDVGPHTKLLYALREFPQNFITTFDDDFYYPPHSVETLLRTSDKVPGAIIGNWVRQLRFGVTGKVMKAKAGKLLTPKIMEREIEISAGVSNVGYDLFAYGTSGILYPPGCMDDRVFDIDLFRTLCPTEDDVWFKAMALLKGVPVATTSLGLTPRHHCLHGSQSVALRHKNHAGSGKTTRNQIRAVFEHFDLYGRMKELRTSCPPCP